MNTHIERTLVLGGIFLGLFFLLLALIALLTRQSFWKLCGYRKGYPNFVRLPINFVGLYVFLSFLAYVALAFIETLACYEKIARVLLHAIP
jgi:uncharacterized membrane protein